MAEAVNVSVFPSSTNWSPMCASAGGWFTSVTLIVTPASTSSAGPSETLTLKLKGKPVPPCASVGVQVNWPDGVMDAPAGAPTSEKVSASPSTSLAAAVNVYWLSSGIVTEPGTPESTGASFTGVTWTLTVAAFESS